MSILLRSFIKLEGNILKHSFDRLTKDPQIIQQKLLSKIINKNLSTEYGCKYNFLKISSENDYKKYVPINSYHDLEPYIDKIINGQSNILTADAPIMFNLTSGTTDKPKYIPVTNIVKNKTTSLIHQWLYRSLIDHPSFLNKSTLLITSSAIEGYTPAKIPYGSLSGLIYKNLPRIVMKSYVLPFIVAEIKNYDLRYFIMSRLALEKDISFIATPNPTTLLKLAEVGIQYQEDIIRLIHDGLLFFKESFDIDAHDSKIIKLLSTSVRSNRLRAKFLSDVMKVKSRLMPRYCWPSLKLIGCWLGGSIGYHADKLSFYYGDILKRDIGYLASEGSVTLPYEDCTSSGILALPNNYYEFIPEELDSNIHPKTLSAYELEVGNHYKILLTNESGLYRYDINDTVKVDKYYNKTPVLSFVRKTDNVLNITGDKLHINHLILAFQKVRSKFNISISQFRVVSNQEKARYDIFIALDGKISLDILQNTVLPAFDSFLSENNIEYLQKRKSKRLNPPCFHIMDSSWEEDVRRDDIESGKRDIQYKWKSLSSELLEIDKRHIKHTISYD